jgi:hypothetical protein
MISNQTKLSKFNFVSGMLKLTSVLLLLLVTSKTYSQSATDPVYGQWSINMGIDRLITEDARKLNAVVMVLQNDGSAYMQVNDINYDVYKYVINKGTTPWQIDLYTNRPASENDPKGGGMIYGIIEMEPGGMAFKIELDPQLGTNRPSSFTNKAYRLAKNL